MGKSAKNFKRPTKKEKDGRKDEAARIGGLKIHISPSKMVFFQ